MYEVHAHLHVIHTNDNSEVLKKIGSQMLEKFSGKSRCLLQKHHALGTRKPTYYNCKVLKNVIKTVEEFPEIDYIYRQLDASQADSSIPPQTLFSQKRSYKASTAYNPAAMELKRKSPLSLPLHNHLWNLLKYLNQLQYHVFCYGFVNANNAVPVSTR